MERVSIPSFILAILYFITAELACPGHTHVVSYIQSEHEALVDFKSGIKDPKNRLSSWKGINYCNWQGIICENDTGFVILIDLHNPYPHENIYENLNSMNLGGEIRPSLGKFKHLKYLDLSFNSFHAMAIPQFLGSLNNLQYLNLSNAGFSGNVPSNLGNLSKLQCLDLSGFEDAEYSNILSIETTEWLTDHVSLKYLGMDYVSIRSQWGKVINKLQNLTELHLCNCNLEGLVPLGLGELPNLQHLDLSYNPLLYGNITQLLSNSWRKIEILKLRGNAFNGSIPSSIGNFCNLSYLDLSEGGTEGNLPEIITGLESCGYEKPLPNLTVLNLHSCDLKGKLPHWLGELRNLRLLDLSNNQLEGPLPDSLWRLQHLKYLNLAQNQLNGSLPNSIGQLSQLQLLDISANNLSGSLPDDIGQLSQLQFLDLSVNSLSGSLPDGIGQLSQLEYLFGSGNLLSGSLPDGIGQLSYLQWLQLSNNNLSGSLPDSIGQLSQLQLLDVSHNHLSGILSEQHFWNLSNLQTLSMGSNFFRLNVSHEWTPPFQVSYIDMHSCHLGPSFPTWLQSQHNLFHTLDFSNASISSPIPNWFWNISSYLEVLSLSHNQIHGQLPNSLPYGFSIIDFSSNLLEGPIPFSINVAGSLDLSRNKFSGSLPSNTTYWPRYLSIAGNGITGTIPEFIGHVDFPFLLDFSSNNLTGSIPSSLSNCSGLSVLDLGNNNLFGEIPRSLGQSLWLESLHLNHNNLSGGIPSSFKNLTMLEVLDASYNKLSSEVPPWIGAAFPNLVILNLRSNIISGRLPSHISYLSSLHVLDLACNKLTGEIPATLDELKSMAQNNITIYPLYYDSYMDFYKERLVVNSKGQSLEYTRTISLVVAIDLSHNDLSEGFPQGITKLFGLVFLNLSRNHINGQIPENISILSQLCSLDLSSNELFGTIPSSFASLTFLEYLNLSDNKFSGKIPFMGQMMTFSESSFLGNFDLCGDPLAIKCQDEDPNGRQPDVDTKYHVDHWIYFSIGLGFAMGILIPYFILVIGKSWCEAYFGFVNGIVKWLLRGRTTHTKNHLTRRV